MLIKGLFSDVLLPPLPTKPNQVALSLQFPADFSFSIAAGS